MATGVSLPKQVMESIPVSFVTHGHSLEDLYRTIVHRSIIVDERMQRVLWGEAKERVPFIPTRMRHYTPVFLNGEEAVPNTKNPGMNSSNNVARVASHQGGQPVSLEFCMIFAAECVVGRLSQSGRKHVLVKLEDRMDGVSILPNWIEFSREIIDGQSEWTMTPIYDFPSFPVWNDRDLEEVLFVYSRRTN